MASDICCNSQSSSRSSLLRRDVVVYVYTYLYLYIFVSVNSSLVWDCTILWACNCIVTFHPLIIELDILEHHLEEFGLTNRLPMFSVLKLGTCFYIYLFAELLSFGNVTKLIPVAKQWGNKQRTHVLPLSHAVSSNQIHLQGIGKLGQCCRTGEPNAKTQRLQSKLLTAQLCQHLCLSFFFEMLSGDDTPFNQLQGLLIPVRKKEEYIFKPETWLERL